MPTDATDEVVALLLEELDPLRSWSLPSPGAEVARLAASLRREPLFVHHLPREEGFVGRRDELALLRSLYEEGQTGMIAIVGIGGVGKSVLLDQLLRALPEADGLLVWSFYRDEDPERFLVATCRYLTGVEPGPDLRGRALSSAVCEALKAAGRVVLVLDGLERAQRDDGRIDADALRDVVERLALGWGRALAFVTTRLSLTDLQHYRGDIYREVLLGALSAEDAAALLVRTGVRGPPASLAALGARFGGHALTLSLLGGALARFFDGDPGCVDEIVGPEGVELLDEAGKLGRVLGYYEQHLSPVERAVLSRMAALPHGATVDFLERFLVYGRGQGAAEALAGLDCGGLRAALGRLLGLHLIQADTKGGLTEYGVHAAIKAHFYGRMVSATLMEVHDDAYRALSALPRAVTAPQPLSERPPRQPRPADDRELSRVEDALYHAVLAGRVREAYDLYRLLLGYEHVGARLGAYAIGERVVRRFFPGGDPAQPIPRLDADQRGFLLTELGLFLRQLGELQKAADCHTLVAGMASRTGELPVGALLHLAHDRLLQGSFHEVQQLAEHARALAEDDREIERCSLLHLCAAHTGLGDMDRARLVLEEARHFRRDDLLLVSVRVDLNLRSGYAARAEHIAREHRQRIAGQSFREEHVTCLLLLAECSLALGNAADALRLVAGAELFISRARWRHAACRVHRLRARAEALSGDARAARGELAAAQQIAERHGFLSLLVDLLVLDGELCLEGNPAAALRCAREARRLAENHAVKYKWGHGDALDLWGRAAARLGERGFAEMQLVKAQQIRRELGNPERVARTEEALAALRALAARRG
ncbi:AAA family ATPase [Sorangium sp. So ce1000]|uniref:AAA family ATPase n=1 Tax=Sorangium sp. So ce1000 TaxID=3133325 RepID=UPI003F63F06E